MRVETGLDNGEVHQRRQRFGRNELGDEQRATALAQTGRGRGVVVATGAGTEIGRIAELAARAAARSRVTA